MLSKLVLCYILKSIKILSALKYIFSVQIYHDIQFDNLFIVSHSYTVRVSIYLRKYRKFSMFPKSKIFCDKIPRLNPTTCLYLFSCIIFSCDECRRCWRKCSNRCKGVIFDLLDKNVARIWYFSFRDIVIYITCTPSVSLRIWCNICVDNSDKSP